MDSPSYSRGPAGLRGTDPEPRTRCRDHAVTGQLVDPGGDSHPVAAARAHSGPDAGAGDPDTGTHARVHGDERRIDTGVHARDTRDLTDRGAGGTYGIAYPGAREPDFHAGRGTSTTLMITIAPVPTDMPKYERNDWKHWEDHDGDCQDARQEVLIAESLVPVTYKTPTGSAGSRPAGGTVPSPGPILRTPGT